MENKNINWDKISNYIYYFFLIALLIWLICFRTDVWLHKSGFCYDEAALLQNIKDRSFIELFTPLDDDQCCPVFFLIINKIIYNIFGLNEIALCFIPYIFGIFSLILIPFISNKIFQFKTFSFLFLIIFTYNMESIFLSQTFKQYSTDTFFCLLIIYLFLKLKDKIVTQQHFLLTGLFFGILGYFSFTTEFLIFPIFIYFIFKLIKGKKIHEIYSISIPYIMLLSIEYFLIKGTYQTVMWKMWDNEIPKAYSSYNEFSELIAYFFNFLTNTNLIFLFFIIGIIILYKKEKSFTIIITLSILLNITSDLIDLYPFPALTYGRAIFYLQPIIIIFCLKAIEALITIFITTNRIKNIIIILISICLINNYEQFGIKTNKIMINGNYHYFIRSNVKEYIKHLENYNVKQSDIIVADVMAHASFDLYSNFKYNKNIIYIDEELNLIKSLPNNTNIWFYNTEHMPNPIGLIDRIKTWINENCEIIIQEKDDMGELFYVKKIK